MMTSSPSFSTASAHDHNVPQPPQSASDVAAEAWFDAAPASARRPSSTPPPVAVVGEFLGDELADSWLR
jgi:hypothetical protein